MAETGSVTLESAGQGAIVGDILDTTKLCGSFPQVFGAEIVRHNVLHTIETFFEGETQLLILEGPDKHEGIGKTVLLAQFARKHADRCLSVFVRPTSWFAYDPSIVLRDLCNQMHWILYHEELPRDSNLDDAYLSRLIFELQRYARRTQKTIVFIVDGITEIPRDRLQVSDVILSKLPFGLPQFRFLFSGPSEDVLKLKTPKLISKTFTLSPFSLEETVSYFGGSMTRDMIIEVFKVSHGVPGYLSRIRKLLENGTAAEDLLDRLPTTDPELFEIEWKAVDGKTETDREILALLAHDRNKHTGIQLADIFRLDPSTILQSLTPFTFLDVPLQPEKEIEFVSDTYRRYAAKRLEHYKDRVNDLVIESLLRSPDSDESLTLLPLYLQQAGRDEALLSYLSPDHVGRMLQKSGSVTPIRERMRMGVETALRVRRDEDLTRLSLQSSVIAELDGFRVSRSEIEARLALGELETCIALAQAAVLKEDRIRLLALIVRKLREKGAAPEAVLVDQIEQLSKEVDFVSLGPDRAVEFAADLMYARPELAMIVLEKAAGRKTRAGTTQESLDWALAALSIQAMLSEERDLKSAAEAFKTKINDPDVVSFSTAASALFGQYTTADVIAEVERIRNPQRKLALLRQWALHVEDEPNTAEIIEYAITLGIKTTEYSPNATHLRELATPLPQVRDPQNARKLIAYFDTQRATVEALGPTEDYARLQLILAEAESGYDRDAACKRLEECYLFISYINDLAIKTASIAALTATLVRIDPLLEFEQRNNIHSLSEADLVNALGRLLTNTAQHTVSTRRVVNALATARPERALEVCLSLNIEARRDMSIHTLVKNILRQPVRKLQFAFLHGVLDRFGDSSERDEAVTGIIDRIASVTDDRILDEISEAVIPILSRSMSIESAGLRTRATCMALQITKRSQSSDIKALEHSLEDALASAWSKMDDDWRRVDAAFNAASTMAGCCKDIARNYLGLAESLRDSVLLENPTLRYAASLSLAVRSYSGLLAARIDTDDDFNDLSTRIERLSSLTSRLESWADVALRCLSNSRLGEAKRVVDEKIQRLLSELEKKDKEEWQEYVRICAPALYISHPKNTLLLLSQLSDGWRNAACIEIAEFICRKVPASDSYSENTERPYNLSYEDITEIIDVLELLSDDAGMYEYISVIVDAAKKRKPAISQQQKAEIVKRLQSLVRSALPSKSGIAHNGWVVVSNAEILRLQRDQAKDWQGLIAQLSVIPNTADRAFSASLVAKAMWSSDPLGSAQLFKEAVTISDTIPSSFHRVDLLHDIASNAATLDPEFAKLCLKQAIKLSSGQRDSDIADAERNIVDLANTLSEEFGSTIAATIDSDPARKGSSKKAKDQLEIDELRKKMLDETVPPEGLYLADEKKLAEAAWKNLGALNAQRIETVPVRHAREYMQCASKMPISSAYPVFAWAIENTNKRMQKVTSEQAVLRGVFRATLQGCDLSAWVATKTFGRFQQSALRAGIGKHVVRAGERERAILLIRDWIEKSGSEYLKVCDPFIGPNELVEILRVVLGSNSRLHVSVVTSRKYQKDVSTPWEDAYRLHWRLSSEQEPPEARIVVAGLPTGDSPLHDRWWITKGSGIRLGTSFNSIGTTKGSEVTNIANEDVPEFEAELDACLNCVMRGKSGEKVTYASFIL